MTVNGPIMPRPLQPMKKSPVSTGGLVGPRACVDDLEERKSLAPAENRTPDQPACSLALQRLPVLYSSEKNTSRCAQGNKLAQNNSTCRIFVNTNDKLSSGFLVGEISTTNHRRLKERPAGVSSGCLIRQFIS